MAPKKLGLLRLAEINLLARDNKPLLVLAQKLCDHPPPFVCDVRIGKLPIEDDQVLIADECYQTIPRAPPHRPCTRRHIRLVMHALIEPCGTRTWNWPQVQ